MDLGNHPALLVLSIAVVSSPLSEIRFAFDCCIGAFDDRSRHYHSEFAGFGELEHKPGNSFACGRFSRRAWTILAIRG
jgi:hypothetical protein